MDMNTEDRLTAVETKLNTLISRLTPTGLPIALPEYLRSGQVFTTQNNNHVILILDSCIRTRDGLVHKWVHIQHFGDIGAGRVNDNAEGFIKDNNMKCVGELKDFLTLNLIYTRS